jgi:hypothetical protein
VEARPPLTVIIPAAHPWPGVAATLDSLVPQMWQVGGEVIVVSGLANAMPPSPPPSVRSLILASRDAFIMRSEAMQVARGAIVAIGEDHVIYCDDWATEVLRAFDREPDKAGFMGSVANGKTGSLDRASFWVTLAPWSAPMASLSLDRTPVPGNVAIRRDALEGIEIPGRFEYEIVPRLLAAGLLGANDRQRVVHDQSLGLIGSWVVHFASGRAYGAATGRGSRWARFREACRAPRVILRQTCAAWREPGRSRDTMTCQVLVAALGVTNGLGQIAGLLFGPGKSGSRIV